MLLNLVLFPEASQGSMEASGFTDLKNHWAEQEIRHMVGRKIVQGTIEHGKLLALPERPITRAEFVTVLVRLLELSTLSELTDENQNKRPIQPAFTDLGNHWAQGYILAAQQKGLAKGYHDGKFGPDRLINRAEAVTLLSRSKNWKLPAAEIAGTKANIPTTTETWPVKQLYSDVTVNHWAYPFILLAQQNRAVSGYSDGTFRPNRKASRAEAFVLISKGFVLQEQASTAVTVSEPTIPTLDTTVLELYKVTKGTADDDGDGLNNQLEILLKLDPTNSDSNHNGITDSKENFDGDGLTNLQEQTYGTDPRQEDTDGDRLSDGQEINIYHTNPLAPDTDHDGLSDGTEVQYGLLPLKPDTNGDGTLDGQEQLTQKVSWQTASNCQVAVDIKARGDLAQLANLSDASGNPELSAIPGLIGQPVDIAVKAEFDTATVEFSFDSATLRGSADSNLQIMWVDEENQRLVPLEKQWLERNRHKVYGNTTHFSKYLVVDKVKWEQPWNIPLQKVPEQVDSLSKRQGVVSLALVIDSSLSMSRNDPSGERLKAVKNFVRGLLPGDSAALIDFDHSARVLQPLSTNLDNLVQAVALIDDAGGTIIDGAIQKGVEQLALAPPQTNKYLILVTDGKDEAGSFDDKVIQEAIKQKVKIFTVGLGTETDQVVLQKLAEVTGGKYYPIQAALEIHKAFERISDYGVMPLDSDGDGLSDQMETAGMRIFTGQLVKTNPKSKDTDGDGIPDGFELGEVVSDSLGREYYRLRSNPTLADSDGDGIVDAEDPQPMNSSFPLKALPILFLHGAMASVSPDFKQVGKYNQVLTNITPLKGGYDGFFNAMEEAGYRDYLHFACYDWRHNTKHSVENYLIPAIERMDKQIKTKIKAELGAEFARYRQANPYFREISTQSVLKFNIVAHSMGGIVVRQLLEGEYPPYNTRVNKLIMVGTPNQGSVNAYTIWQGGVGQDLTYKLLLRFFLGEFYRQLYGGKPSLDYDSGKMLGIIRNYFPSVKALLPTWNCLVRPGKLPARPIYQGLGAESINDTLGWLNKGENLNKLYRRTKVLTIAGTGQEVYKGIWLTPKTGLETGLLWPDGKPARDGFGNFRFETDPVGGDGTVRVDAARLLANSILLKGEHSLLLSEKAVVNKVLSELAINYTWAGELSLLDNQAVMLNDIAGM
ncbi:MAG: S-layer homology domain-containing protein [Carboxydocellales bacterium]